MSRPPRRTRPVRARRLNAVANVALTFAAVGGAICIALVLAATLFHITLIMFKTGSMAPSIPAGSLAIVQEIPAQDVEVGDVVTVDRGAGLLPITHRVVAATPQVDGTTSLTLQGDANEAPDATDYRVTTVRIVLASIPGLAMFVASLSHPLVLAITTLVVSVLVGWAFWPRRPETSLMVERRGEHVAPARRVRRNRTGRRARRSRWSRRSDRRRPANRHATSRRSAQRRSPAHRLDRRALAGVGVIAGILLSTFSFTAMPVSSANAAIVEETIVGEHLTLISVRDPDAMTAMLPGVPVDWQLGIQTDPLEPGEIDVSMLATGSLTDDATGLWLQVSRCPTRWVAGVCAAGGELLTALRPASEMAGAQFDLGRLTSTAGQWLLVRAMLPADPDISGTGVAHLSIRAEGQGETLTANGSGSSALSATGLSVMAPLQASGLAIALGLVAAFGARMLRRRLP